MQENRRKPDFGETAKKGTIIALTTLLLSSIGATWLMKKIGPANHKAESGHTLRYNFRELKQEELLKVYNLIASFNKEKAAHQGLKLFARSTYSYSDEYWQAQDYFDKKMYPTIKTLFEFIDEHKEHISGSQAKELRKNIGTNITGYVAMIKENIFYLYTDSNSKMTKPFQIKVPSAIETLAKIDKILASIK